MSKFTSPDTPRPDRARFPKSARLRTTHEFSLVRKQGRMAQGKYLRMGILDGMGSQEVRLGLVTSKRAGNAVERNRIRRHLREVFRVNRSRISRGILMVIVAKSSAALAEARELREEWLLLAQRLSILPRS